MDKIKKPTIKTASIIPDKQQLVIRFNYDPDLVAKVKTLSGRRWNPESKSWTAPVTQSSVQDLQQWGFELSPGIEQWLKDQEPKPATEIKAAHFHRLFPYQQEGVLQMERWRGRMVLGDDPGLGKTAQALVWLDAHPELRPAVVVCPATIKFVWEREAKAWMGITPKVEILKGKNGKSLPKADLYIINYDILSGWIDELKKLNLQVIIGDEIHYIKSPKSIRTKAFKSLCKGVPYVLPLSGTLMLNRPAEGFIPLNIVAPSVFPSFTKYAFRYCLPAEAPILMSDLSEKPIHQICPNDKIIGWSRGRSKRGNKYGQRRLGEAVVLRVLKRKAPLQEVELHDGTKIVCTPDHRWLTGDSKSDNEDIEYSIAKVGTRYKGRGRGCSSKIVRVLERLQFSYVATFDYKRGYLFGLFDGDGYCSIKSISTFQPLRGRTRPMIYQYRCGAATKDAEPIDRAEQYARDLGLEFHRAHRDGLHHLYSQKKRESEFLNDIGEQTKEWWAGYLGGIYDAEGSGQTISQFLDVNPHTFKRIQTALSMFGFIHKTADRLGKITSIRMVGGRTSLLRFWSIANPSLYRKLKSYLFNGGGKFMQNRLSVKAVKPLPGLHDTYTLTTTTGNYVAYGLGSKNCGARHNGFGWDFSGATHIEELHKLMTETCYLRRNKIDVLKDLPDKLYSILPMEIDNRKEYDAAANDLALWLRENGEKTKAESATRAEALVKIEVLKQLAVKGILKDVYEWIENFLAQGQKLVLFAHHKTIINALMERFKDAAVKVDGSVSGEDRQKAVDRFQTDDSVRLFVGSRAAKEGLSLGAASNVAFMEYPWGPGDLVQMEGRCEGLRQKGGVNIWYLVAKDTIIETICGLIDKKRKVLDQVLEGKSGEESGIFGELLEQLRG